MISGAVQNKEETIARLREHYGVRDDIALLIVHGSAAQDHLRPDSDIDIALALRHPLSIDEKLDYILDFSKTCGREIDLSDLRTIGGLFLHQVLSKGILIINRDIELYTKLVQKSLIYIEDIHPIHQNAQTQRIKEFINGR
ncbi:MAG: type VII toxin-antitoxin system MntA family adenylyltransferase antitoxin [Rectinema subterraneum]|uniref:type VII toxin-antitoxin system MntA family adenylyltransferase antitoxin n=1 Tax=Rectinema subterraneum TaxID=2653714 RepID=UPI003C7A9E8F